MQMKHCVHSFHLVCQLLLKILMLPAENFFVPLIVRYQAFYTHILMTFAGCLVSSNLLNKILQILYNLTVMLVGILIP